MDSLNKTLDVLAEFLANRKGLLPLIGILLVSLNWVLGVLPLGGWFINSDFLLHLGVILAVLGLMLAKAL